MCVSGDHPPSIIIMIIKCTDRGVNPVPVAERMDIHDSQVTLPTISYFLVLYEQLIYSSGCPFVSYVIH